MTDRYEGNGSGRAPTDRFQPLSASNHGTVPATADESGRGDGVPTPAWVPTDDVIGSTPDKQVLVVGDTPTGLAIMSLLRAAGYDPVLAGAADLPTASRVTFLSPAAMEVLGSLDAGPPLLDSGVVVDAVAVGSVPGDERVDVTVRQRPGDTGRAPAITAPTPLLYRALDSGLASETTARDRTVGSVSVEDGGVAVRFDDGVREWFDLVVDAGVGSLRAQKRAADAGRPGTVCQYEATVEGLINREIRDVWVPNGLVQWLPASADCGTLVRITTTVTESAAGEQATRTASGLSEFPGVPDFEAFKRARVKQARLPRTTVPPEWWGSGRIACCGRAACPTAPAAGVGPSLGLTDALGLVSALSHDGTAVPEAIDAYAASRARRFDNVRHTAAGPDRALQVPESAPEPMQSLGVLRATALKPFAGTAPAALRKEAPG